MHAKREPARPRDGDAFLVLHPFMWKELGLKGTTLLVFARIYGFCKDGGTFYESRRRTATYIGVSELRHQGGVRAGAERAYRRSRRRMGKGRDDHEELCARPSRDEDVLRN